MGSITKGGRDRTAAGPAEGAGTLYVAIITATTAASSVIGGALLLLGCLSCGFRCCQALLDKASDLVQLGVQVSFHLGCCGFIILRCIQHFLLFRFLSGDFFLRLFRFRCQGIQLFLICFQLGFLGLDGGFLFLDFQNQAVV